MGNKLCKKKPDLGDNPKSPTPFDRIINRLHLRPTSWKSESYLHQKDVGNNKSQVVEEKNVRNARANNMARNQPISKSSDWTEVSLEVPQHKNEVHQRNPKLSLIFDNENSTPVPPPRKHKKGFKERLEAVAKTGLQAFQSKKPVEEPLCVKKIVKHTCPEDEHDCAIHNRNHKHAPKKRLDLDDKKKEERLKMLEKDIKTATKEAKRKKNLSVVSLPNYSELKLTVANFEDIDGSMTSLPVDAKKIQSSNTSKTGGMPRCRSFGSLLPQQLLDKLKVRKIQQDIESDDSFGGLEDWDLRIIEHYNPKEASLPRTRKPPKIDSKRVLSDIESLIVKDDAEPLKNNNKPVAPARRSDSFLKKVKSALTPHSQKNAAVENHSPSLLLTPPSTSVVNINSKDCEFPYIDADKVPVEEETAIPKSNVNQVEHSSLIKILEQYSIKEKRERLLDNESFPSATIREDVENPIPTKRRNVATSSIEDFLHRERLNANMDLQANFTNMEMVKT